MPLQGLYMQTCPKDKIKAIQETIAGFLNDQVIDPKGEHYYNHKEQLQPNIDDN
jgi:hypothetical protein